MVSNIRCPHLVSCQIANIILTLDRDHWPTLSFNRSLEAAFVTTRAEPSHDIAVALHLGELLLWVTAGALVIVVSTTHDFNLWYDGTPVLYTLWGVCVLCMAIRIYIYFQYEITHVNRTLVLLEYSRWTTSFDASTRNVADNAIMRKPLSQSYQFHSWTLIAVIWSCSLAALLTGLLVAPPRLRFITYAGGALLIEMTVRDSTELTWRLFRVGKPARRLMRKIRTAEQRRYDRTGDATTVWRVLLGEFKMKWVVPTIWSHNPQILREAFEDPMYISSELY